MKPLFNRKSFPRLRFILVILMAVGIIISDKYFGVFNNTKKFIDATVNYLYVISNSPYKLWNTVLQLLSSQYKLQLENQTLQQELLLKNSELLILERYKQENIHLRELLDSPLRQNEQKMITQVISVINNPYQNQLLIDKGSANGVYDGQPVINDKGIVGQVVSVSKSTSRILLICDISHALPSQILRNGVRVIVAGTGCRNDLQLRNIPANADIKVGDTLVTSGLDGYFPEGYPVAIVSSVILYNKRTDITVKARPTANLQNLKFLLLFSTIHHTNSSLLTSREVSLIANERLTHFMSKTMLQSNIIRPSKIENNIAH